MVKIGLERIDIQEGVTVEVLLDSGATKLVMSSEFAKKQGFKLKKIKQPIYVRNVNGSFNKDVRVENDGLSLFYFSSHFSILFYFLFFKFLTKDEERQNVTHHSHMLM